MVNATRTFTVDKPVDVVVVFVGRNETATSTDDIMVRPAQSGSEITYHARIEFHGVAKLVAPVMKLEFEKLGRDTEQQLSKVIAGL